MQITIAAKTDVGVVRTNNEDNFQVAADLASGKMQWVNNGVVDLGPKGALLVVADGMGGMNAGEVASELAIQTVKELFAPERLTPAVMKDRFSIEKYMNDAIVAADARIKCEGRENPETKGMGTTIVIGWLLDGKLYLSWCGDSRAYIYNPAAGLHQISKDHSYVQNLVDKGAITREDAFDYPDSNIITRCLSDSTSKAVPESLLHPYQLCDGDIIMLCTDGLSGMLRDREMEATIRANEDDMSRLADILIQEACDAEGSDNITICLCKILKGGATCDPKVFDEYEKRLNGNVPKTLKTHITTITEPKNRTWLFLGIGILAVVAILLVLWVFWLRAEPTIQTAEEESDSTAIQMAEQTPSDAGEQQTLTDIDGKPMPEGEGIKLQQGAGAGVAGSIRSILPQEGETSEGSSQGGGNEGGSDELTPVNAAGSGQAAGNGSEDDGLTTIKKPAKKPETQDYEVKSGENFSKIATKFHTTVQVLQELNPGIDPSKLQPGQKIKVPKS